MQALADRINKPTPSQRWLRALALHNQKVKSYPKGPYIARPCVICSLSDRSSACIICGRNKDEIIFHKLPYAKLI